MALTQYYERQFSEGVDYTRKALSEATAKGQADWSADRYAQALFYAGYASFLEDMLVSFQATYKNYQDLGFTAGTSIAEQSSIAATVMQDAAKTVYIPKSSGKLSPAIDAWNTRRFFLTGIYMAGRWKAAMDWYNAVMLNKFGWAKWRGYSEIPFWGDIAPGTGYYT